MAQNDTPIEEQYGQFPMLAFLDLPDLGEAELKVLIYITRQIKNYPGVTRRILSTDEIQHGRKRQDGSRFDRGTGLSNRAVIDAIRKLEKRKLLFPATESGGQKSYAVMDCQPLTEGKPMKKVHRQQAEQETQEASPMKKVHSTYEERSQDGVNNLHSSREKSSQEAADESRPQEARRDARDTLRDTSTDTLRDTAALPASTSLSKSKRDATSSADALRSEDISPTKAQPARFEQARRPRPARAQDEWLDDRGREHQLEPAESGTVELPAQDLDTLQQRQVAEHAIQKLLAEQEQLRVLLPSQRGWGAAQGRLRSIAREIERLQAEAASSAEPAAATGKAESTQLRRSPAAPPPQASATPALSGQATRRQRLTKLQEELAQLKKTPSMQLLARRRIPLLEAEIKRLIAEMQQSA